MANLKISEMPAATLPLAGTEGIPCVQNGVNRSLTPVALRATQTAITDLTADAALSSSQSGITFTNAGATGTVIATLPTPARGLEFSFVIEEAQTLVVDIAGAVVISLGEIASSAGGNVSSSSPYSALTLRALSSTLWVATSMIGTWTAA